MQDLQEWLVCVPKREPETNTSNLYQELSKHYYHSPCAWGHGGGNTHLHVYMDMYIYRHMYFNLGTEIEA